MKSQYREGLNYIGITLGQDSEWIISPDQEIFKKTYGRMELVVNAPIIVQVLANAPPQIFMIIRRMMIKENLHAIIEKVDEFGD